MWSSISSWLQSSEPPLALLRLSSADLDLDVREQDLRASSPEEICSQDELKSRLSLMGNLTTVLALLLGIEIAQLRAIEGVETTGFAVVAVVAASVAVGFTIVGLGAAISCQSLLAVINERQSASFSSRLVKRLGRELPAFDSLLNFPMLALAFSCPCTIVSLGCSVCMRYDYHWSALVAATILVVALFALQFLAFAFRRVRDISAEVDMDTRRLANKGL